MRKCLLLSLLFITPLLGLAQLTGLLSPSTNVNIAGVNNPGRAYTSNDSYAVFGALDDAAKYAGFSISIPSGANILGIEVRLEGNVANNRDLNISLTWDNGTTYTSEKPMTRFGTTDDFRTVGGSTDTWGRTWSLSELTSTNFGVRCRVPASASGNLNLDHLQVNIYYSTTPCSY